eukprot:731810-Hanusia_phi.AAC.1
MCLRKCPAASRHSSHPATKLDEGTGTGVQGSELAIGMIRACSIISSSGRRALSHILCQELATVLSCQVGQADLTVTLPSDITPAGTYYSAQTRT